MDRKAWIVVTLCLVGMGINGWWMMTHPQPKAAPPAPAPAATPGTPATAANPATTPAPSAPGTSSTPATNDAKPELFELKNDSAKYVFTTKGGGILTATLLDSTDQIVLNEKGKAAIGTLSGEAKKYDDWDYKKIDQTGSSITFQAETDKHLLITKEYSFAEGGDEFRHLVDFKLTLKNNNAAGGEKLSKPTLQIYAGAAHSLRPDEIIKPAFGWNNAGDADSKDTGYFGSGFFSAEKADFLKALDRVRWAGPMSRFYVQLISTKEDQAGSVWSERFPIDHSTDEFKDLSAAKSDFGIHGGLGLPPVDLDAGEKKSFEFRMYLGPKIYRDLARIDNVEPDRQLRDVMFYGWFRRVSQFLVWLMRVFHGWFANWGIAIILLTLFVRTVLWPVQSKANMTMKRMGLLSPKLKELQAKFKDNPQKQQQEMMKLYREYGVNPLGGCLPMLVQIPIFFGFYRALQYAAELRGQSFLWVHDLSLPDTIGHLPSWIPVIGGAGLNPLPLVMVLTNFLQIKLTPQPATSDNSQRRMMMFMPFIFLFICYGFASALALYWTTQNIYSILQAQIQRKFGKEPELKRVPIPVGPAASQRPSFGGAPEKKKDRPGPPRLGGGGTKSRGREKS